MTGGNPKLLAWIDFVFDHPVTDPGWFWLPDGAAVIREDWHESQQEVAIHIADTFENSGELLSRFSDDQVAQGCWYLFGFSEPRFMLSLFDKEVPLAIRLRALKSFVPLFEQVMGVRCSPRLCNKEAGPLNVACYMWFDCLLDRIEPQNIVSAQLDQEVLVILRRILAIPHDACRESALHGIGHWIRHYPQLGGTIDEFLASNGNLHPGLIEYAEHARRGRIL